MKKQSKPSASTRIRVLIADDHLVVREGLMALVKSQPDMAIVGEAANGRQAVEQFLFRQPDVLLLDLRMPEMNGIEVIQAILTKVPQAKIIVLSTYSGDEDIFRALKAGARAYLLKDCGREQLLNSIRAVHRGELSISPEVGVRLAVRVAEPSLTYREAEILRHMAAGKSNKEIGALLSITEGTVKIHIGRILKKLGASGRTQAIRIALEKGIVHLDSFYGI
jgi:DNA-binding NarL/FixJ family response regulator